MKANWSFADIEKKYTQPFNDLLHEAHTLHRNHHQPNQLQLAQLLSIKTGACPEDCGYCSQSGHHNTNIKKEKLLDKEQVLAKARLAKASGAKRFCMGAAWKSPPEKAMPKIIEMIKDVKKLGLETCMTLGMLSAKQAKELKKSGLDYYNHNIDTSPSFYKKVVTTREFSERLDTLSEVLNAGIGVCCGGILGLGETVKDRIEFLYTLASLDSPPESIPINRLIPVAGTPMENNKGVDVFEIVRMVATARIIFPRSTIRLSAGRTSMSDELQALCFYAGANSVFMGETLLTEDNPAREKDNALFDKLGLEAKA